MFDAHCEESFTLRAKEHSDPKRLGLTEELVWQAPTALNAYKYVIKDDVAEQAGLPLKEIP